MLEYTGDLKEEVSSPLPTSESLTDTQVSRDNWREALRQVDWCLFIFIVPASLCLQLAPHSCDMATLNFTILLLMVIHHHPNLQKIAPSPAPQRMEATMHRCPNNLPWPYRNIYKRFPLHKSIFGKSSPHVYSLFPHLLFIYSLAQHIQNWTL